VKFEPKTGSSAFYRGYTDGYLGAEYNPDFPTSDEHRMYEEGYDKGQLHSDQGMPERYRYVSPKDRLSDGKWPFPKTGPMGY
jgi:hypothetical protein